MTNACKQGVVLLTILWASVSQADAGLVTNGSFEGSLGEGSFVPGWDFVGNASVRDAATTGVTPTDGAWHAFISNREPTVTDTAIEFFLSLPPGALDGISTGNAVEGSAIRQLTVQANAGDTLEFDWNFLTNEFPDDEFNDFGFWSLVPDTSPGFPLVLEVLWDVISDAFTTGPQGGSVTNEFFVMTGYQPASYTFSTTGFFTLGFGVMDVGDATDDSDDPQVGPLDSALLVDNVRITPEGPVVVIPEPTSLAIWSLLAMSSVGIAVRRRWKVAASARPSDCRSC